MSPSIEIKNITSANSKSDLLDSNPSTSKLKFKFKFEINQKYSKIDKIYHTFFAKFFFLVFFFFSFS
jgi:hypothetical protein